MVVTSGPFAFLIGSPGCPSTSWSFDCSLYAPQSVSFCGASARPAQNVGPLVFPPGPGPHRMSGLCTSGSARLDALVVTGQQCVPIKAEGLCGTPLAPILRLPGSAPAGFRGDFCETSYTCQINIFRSATASVNPGFNINDRLSECQALGQDICPGEPGTFCNWYYCEGGVQALSQADPSDSSNGVAVSTVAGITVGTLIIGLAAGSGGALAGRRLVVHSSPRAIEEEDLGMEEQASTESAEWDNEEPAPPTGDPMGRRGSQAPPHIAPSGVSLMQLSHLSTIGLGGDSTFAVAAVVAQAQAKNSPMQGTGPAVRSSAPEHFESPVSQTLFVPAIPSSMTSASTMNSAVDIPTTMSVSMPLQDTDNNFSEPEPSPEPQITGVSTPIVSTMQPHAMMMPPQTQTPAGDASSMSPSGHRYISPTDAQEESKPALFSQDGALNLESAKNLGVDVEYLPVTQAFEDGTHAPTMAPADAKAVAKAEAQQQAEQEQKEADALIAERGPADATKIDKTSYAWNQMAKQPEQSPTVIDWLAKDTDLEDMDWNRQAAGGNIHNLVPRADTTTSFNFGPSSNAPASRQTTVTFGDKADTQDYNPNAPPQTLQNTGVSTPIVSTMQPHAMMMPPQTQTPAGDASSMSPSGHRYISPTDAQEESKPALFSQDGALNLESAKNLGVDVEYLPVTQAFEDGTHAPTMAPADAKAVAKAEAQQQAEQEQKEADALIAERGPADATKIDKTSYAWNQMAKQPEQSPTVIDWLAKDTDLEDMDWNRQAAGGNIHNLVPRADTTTSFNFGPSSNAPASRQTTVTFADPALPLM
eukprot:gene10774-1958_t